MTAAREGRGIARQLVEGIVERHSHRAGIRLSCRKDYEADAMWPHLGFRRLGEKPGRGRDQLPLVAWWRPIAARTLFDEPEQDDPRMVAAIDTNVLLDILEQRDFPASLGAYGRLGSRSSRTGRDGAEPLRTFEPAGQERGLRVNAGRVPHPENRPRRRGGRSSVPLENEPSTSRVGDGDRRVIAQAAASNADYLVTRDEALLLIGGSIREGDGRAPGRAG